jgi:EmrB/QacA subfamily drug resistance transporter
MASPTTDPFPTSDRDLKRTALAVSTLAGFLTPFMGSAVNVALPDIAAEFSLKAVTLGWVATAYLLTAAIFLVPLGRLADIVGRKKIFLLGVSIFTLASLLAAAAPSAAALLASRALQGLGGAMIFSTSMAILTCVFPPGERGKAIGISTAAVYLGLSLGPVVGGFLVHRFGWRSVFYAVVPVGLAGIVLAVVRLRGEWDEAKGEKFDAFGSGIFGLGLAALMYGFSRLPSPFGGGLVAAGLALLGAFILWEMRVSAPVLDIRLFRANRVFAFSNAAALINYSATSAASFLLSLYLQYVKGLPPQKAGLVLVAQPVIMALASPFAGRLSDRTEPRLIASTGMALSAAGLVLLSFLGPGTSFGFIVGSLVCLGLGFGLFSSPNTNAVMGSVGKRHLGIASAALGTMRLTGQMMSAGIAMMIFALFMGHVPIEPPVYPLFLRSIRFAFAFFAALCVAGVFASLARGDRPPADRA